MFVILKIARREMYFGVVYVIYYITLKIVKYEMYLGITCMYVCM